MFAWSMGWEDVLARSLGWSHPAGSESLNICGWVLGFNEEHSACLMEAVSFGTASNSGDCHIVA